MYAIRSYYAPTLFLVTGERLRGGLPADRLAAALDESARVRKN